jgi:hypothetical protein
MVITVRAPPAVPSSSFQFPSGLSNCTAFAAHSGGIPPTGSADIAPAFAVRLEPASEKTFGTERYGP